MKASKVLWVASLIFLSVGALVTSSFGIYFARLQTKLLLRMGDDISNRADKWKDASFDGVGAFSWWTDLDVGHGLVSQFSGWAQLALLALALQLGITLLIKYRGRSH